MICDELKRSVYFFLDGELGSTEIDNLRDHVRACPECDDRVVIQTRLRRFIRLRFTRQTASAPPSLRDRIRAAFAALRQELM